MNKRGQALVEFVLILPVLVMILFCIIDFGKILYTKTNLESKLDNIISLYDNKKTYEELKSMLTKEDKEISFTITNESDKYITFKLIKNIEVITPGLNLVLDDPFPVEVKRAVYHE